MAIERLSVHYRFSGATLDIDALLASARPVGAHEVWHRGESLGDGHLTRTAGVQVEIGDFVDAVDAVEAIDGFLETEDGFLAAVGRAVTDETLSVVAIALWVTDDEPVEFAVPPESLSRLAGAGVTLTATGYPTHEDE